MLPIYKFLYPSLNMEEVLMLPVDYNDEELEFEMKIQQGYVPKVEIIIDGIPVIFETDNDERYRAIVSHEQMHQNKYMSTGLLQAIANQLEILFNS
jgi:hypothetical protein